MSDVQQPDNGNGTSNGNPAGKSAGGSAPEARRYGFPAVYDHEVCAVRTVEGGEGEDGEPPPPAEVQLLRWRKGSGVVVKDLPLERLYVWARAGRVSFGDQ